MILHNPHRRTTASILGYSPTPPHLPVHPANEPVEPEAGEEQNAGEDRQDRANAYLRDRVACSRRFLEFSSGMFPLVEHQQVMHTIFTVRTAGGGRSRLAREYGHLFGPQREYVDSRDPLTIHIACLIVAFPAFLIHALEEGRRLFQAEHAPMPADLWPEPTRAQDGRP